MAVSDDNVYMTALHACYYTQIDDKTTFRCAPMIRHAYVIHYVNKGSGFFVQNGIKYRVTKGQCFLITPLTMMEYYPDENDPWQYSWIDLKGHEVTKILSYSSLNINNPVTEADDGTLDLLFKQAADNIKDISPAGKCRSVAYFRLILAYIIEHNMSPNEASKMNEIAARCAHFVTYNYSNPDFSVQTLADIMGMNRTTLFRHFVNSYGIPLSDYITNVRIDHAKKLLKNSSHSIKLISMSVGYENNLYFSKVFKKKVGLTPTEFRNKILDDSKTEE